MFADVLLSIAFIGGCAALIDFFINDQRKKQLDYRILHLWNWLDDMKRRSVLDWLRRHWAAYWAALISAVVAIIYARWIIVQLGNTSSPSLPYVDKIVAILFWVGGLWLTVQFNNWSLSSRNLHIAVLRLALVLIGVIFVIFGLVLVADQYQVALTPVDGQVTLFQLIYVIGFGISLLAIGLILPCWAVVAVPMLLLWGASLIIWFLELMIRKIAEFPRGAVAGVSVLFAAAAAILKLFG